MAREIHDGVIQRLFGVALALGSEAPSSEELERCAEQVQLALSDLRTALQRPLGRSPRPTETTVREELERLAAQHSELAVDFEHEAETDLPAALEPLAQSVLVEAVPAMRTSTQSRHGSWCGSHARTAPSCSR